MAALAAAAATLFAAEQGRKEVPSIYVGGVVNAASFVPAPDNFIAPGAIVSIFGDDLALRTRAVTQQDLERGRMPLSLGGVTVKIGGQRAPLFFVSPGQINAQVPTSLRPRDEPWELEVVREGLLSVGAARVTVRAAAPGLFAVIAHENFSVVGRGEIPGSTPARPGETVTVFATGLGPMNPPVTTGLLAGFPATITLPHRVFLGGAELANDAALYIGQAPGFAGLQQVNLTLPQTLGPGDYEVVIEVDGVLSQAGVLIAVE